MADQETIDGLLEGAFDTHIHSAPDVLPRKFNDLELAQRFKARRMAGFVLKSHYICTADRATLVNQIVPEVQAFGAIALNNSVGGLNPLALDIAGRLGDKVVFLPSVDNANELENVAGPARREQAAVLDEHRPRDARAGHRRRLAERDRRRQGHPGHAPVPGDHRQARHGAGDQPHPAVRDAARGQGRQRGRASSASSSPIPSSRRRCSASRTQQELARLGVYFERCFTTPNTGKISLGAGLRQHSRGRTRDAPSWRPTSARRTTPYPDEGLGMFIGQAAGQRLRRSRGPHHGARQRGSAARRTRGRRRGRSLDRDCSVPRRSPASRRPMGGCAEISNRACTPRASG